MANSSPRSLIDMMSDSIAGTVSNVGGFLNPACKLAGEYLSYRGLPIKLPSIEDLITMNDRGYLNETDLKKFLLFYGIRPEWISGYEAINRQYLSPHEYVQLWQRKKITTQFLDKMLKEIKAYDQKQQYINSMEYFPNVPDLVRFAVREAYTPETLKKFGQLDELPAKFLEEASKAGLPTDQAKNYWASHWELPSMQMGFEMLHRTTKEKIDEDADEITMPSGEKIYNVIGTKTMNLLIKSLDITPFWRDKLKQISYNPLTRVDVRRMYAMGVINEDKVFTSYLDEGYNEENALLLTNYVVKEFSQDTHGLTRATLEKAFKEDLISADEYKQNLMSLKMTEETADFFVALAEYDKHIAELKTLIDTLSLQYQEGTITIDQIRAKITLENVPTSFVESAINKIQKQKITTRKLPSLTDCQRWLKGGFITSDSFKTRLRMLGYSQEDTEIYMREIT